MALEYDTTLYIQCTVAPDELGLNHMILGYCSTGTGRNINHHKTFLYNVDFVSNILLRK